MFQVAIHQKTQNVSNSMGFKKNVIQACEGRASQGWVIQLTCITKELDLFLVQTAILSMAVIISIGLMMATQLQALYLHTPTPEAENTAAPVLSIFVKEIFPRSKCLWNTSPSTYQILPSTAWLKVHPKTSCW